MRAVGGKIAGLMLVVALAVAVVVLWVLQVRGPVFNPPELAMLLHLLLVFGTRIVIVVVSAKAYLRAGSLGVLLLGASLLISGLATTIPLWALTPALHPTLTHNTSVTIANSAILIAAVLQLLSALAVWGGTGSITVKARRKMVLTTTYLLALLVVAVITALASGNSMPAFRTAAGSTPIRIMVLTIAILLTFVSGFIFGWQYAQTKSPIMYWCALALGLFGIALVSVELSIRIGDPMNWVARFALYLSGIYFLIALWSSELSPVATAGLSERWADAFSNDRAQLITLFANLLHEFAYCKVITDETGSPRDYVFIGVNKAFEQSNGLSGAQIVGQRATVVFPNLATDPADWIGILGRVALTGEPVTFENYLTAARKWYAVSAYSPQPGYFVQLSQDITARKQAEAERERLLDEVERRAAELDATINSIAVGVVIYDPAGHLQRVNAAAEYLLGAKKQALGVALPDLFRFLQLTKPDGAPFAYDEALSYRALQGETLRDVQQVVHRPDHSTLWVSTSAAPIRTPDGELLGAVTSFTDITPLHEFQERERRYLYMLAHNLRAPTTIIQGNLQLLLEMLQSHDGRQPYHHLTEALQRGLHRMSTMIDDFTLVTRLEDGAIILHTVPVTLPSYLRDLLRRNAPLLETSRIQLDLPPDLPPVLADPDRLETIFLNLLQNAQKFSAPATPIQVSARPPSPFLLRRASRGAGAGAEQIEEAQSEVVISVTDQGIGITPADIPHIFDRFYRAEQIRKAEGTGLGLYITKRLVEAHALSARAGTAKAGGRIWVKSEVGKGSTFFFSLPIASETG